MIVRLINIFFDRKKNLKNALSCQTDKMGLSYVCWKIMRGDFMKKVNKSANRQNRQKPYLLR